MTTSRADTALAIPGLALLVAFFMPWIDILGMVDASGFDLATADQLSAKRYLLWLSPVLGAALAFTAMADGKSARNLGLAAGLAVVGPVLYYLGKGMLFGTSWGLWMVIAGSVALIICSLSNKPESMAVPAVLIIAGFFLPWTTKDQSFASWGLTGLDIARAPSLPSELGLPSPKLAWLVPLAGAAALVGALFRDKAAKTIGLVAGIAVIGWLVWFIGRSFSFFTGWGLWLTIAAGAVALVISLRR